MAGFPGRVEGWFPQSPLFLTSSPRCLKPSWSLPLLAHSGLERGCFSEPATRDFPLPPAAGDRGAPRCRPSKPAAARAAERGGFSIINLETRADFITISAGAGFPAARGLLRDSTPATGPRGIPFLPPLAPASAPAPAPGSPGPPGSPAARRGPQETAGRRPSASAFRAGAAPGDAGAARGQLEARARPQGNWRARGTTWGRGRWMSLGAPVPATAGSRKPPPPRRALPAAPPAH